MPLLKRIWLQLRQSKLKLAGLMVASLLISACSAVTKEHAGSTAGNQMEDTLKQGIDNNQKLANQKSKKTPNSVNQSLVPQMNIQSPDDDNSQDKTFNVQVDNVSAKKFFRGLVEDTSLNIVVNPKVEGNITLHLKNVTIPQVLQAVKNAYGYQYEKTHYGYQIKPREIKTRVFNLDYLNVQRSGESTTKVETSKVSQSGGEGGGGGGQLSSQVTTSSTSDFWKELKQTLSMIIGDSDGHQVILNPGSGTIIVKAYPNELDQVSQYIDHIQKTITRQVIINAKVLEIQLSTKYQGGIDWSAFGGDVAQETLSGSPDIGDILKIDMKHGDKFSATINMLSEQGNVQVLSSPRVSTLNNQKAVIKVGSDEFFVTDVSSTSQGSGDDVQQTSDVDLTPFFSGIALDVTPEINNKDEVILHIHPVVSTVSEEKKKFTVDGKEQSLPLARSKTRESDSVVRAKNGQIIVIGGLMKNRTEENNSGVPFLDKSAAGPLFRGTNQSSQKTELVILLKPTVVNNKRLNKQLKQDAKKIKQMNKGFHFGSHPEVFGNEAEPDINKPVKRYAK